MADYSRDTEFSKLLARGNDVDLTIAALELARDADPNLEFHTTIDWIQERADELLGPVARNKNEGDALGLLSGMIAGSYGICGDQEAYSRADSSYLNRIIETRRGIPISLSVLYMAIARRVNLELNGVATPMHFVTRLDSSEGPLFVDAYSNGRIMTFDECVERMTAITGISGEQIISHLEPAGPREIIIRMLNNLKGLFARQEDWTAALKVQHRLSALQPASYPERRDLAVISLKSNRPGEAINLLNSCLKMCPDQDRDVLQRRITEAETQLARWN